MSLMGMAFVINSPLISNQFLKFDIHRKTPFCSPTFGSLKLKQSKTVYRKSLTLEGSIETGGGNRDGGVSFHETVGGLHTIVNHLSKWFVIATYSGFILLRHDGFTFWATLGCALNNILSLALKRCLKQERPVSGLSSSPGMPSSHAQTLFYTIILVILSLVKSRGLNGVTAILSSLVATLGSYFSWLRVARRYHTMSQVVVGAVVGSVFSVIWFRAWEEIVHKAYISNLWVRILVGGGVICSYFGFYMFMLLGIR